MTIIKFFSLGFLILILNLLFIYNSGLGYDQIEYFLLAKYISNGGNLYDYYPSKGPLLYYLLSAIYKIFEEVTRYHISILILLVSIITIIVNYIIILKLYNKKVAIISSILIYLLFYFCELNFLQPNFFQFIFCLLSIYYFTKNKFFISGFFLMICSLFKANILLIGLPFVYFLIIDHLIRGNFFNFLKVSIEIFCGFVFPLLFIFIFINDIFYDLIYWSYIYPLIKYPPNYEYFDKVYTKLLFWNLFYLYTIFLFIKKRYKSKTDKIFLLCSMVSLLVIFKNQASHYFFISFALISIVFSSQFENIEIRKNKIINKKNIFLLFSIFILIIYSSISYRPDIFKRFTHIKEFNEDVLYKDISLLNNLEDKEVLYLGLGDTYFYFLTNTLPPKPYISNDQKFGFMLKENPKYLYDLINNQHIENIIFDEKKFKIIDQTIDDKTYQKIKKKVKKKLINNDYKLKKDSNMHLWTKN